jgi:UDP-N-acetylglucosamine 2-epimerase (non-hydrolysing)
MKNLKVVTVVGTRPEIIRLSRVVAACDRYFDHVLVHTGQNWDFTLNEIFFQELQIRKPDHFLASPGKHLGETIGNIISRSYELFQKLRPDALLVLGDTNSALCAIPAKRLKIPIFHMEAGNRCFDQNVPEEINRKIVDHVSDVNLPYTEHSRRYLLSEGIRKEHVFVTGSPMAEVLDHYRSGIEESDVLARQGLKRNGYLVVSAHREENLDIDENLESLVDALDAIAREFKRPIVYSTHPRARQRLRRKRVRFHPLIRNVKPFGFFDYNQLQRNAFCVLSDSGTLSEESAMLRFPAALIRTSTERPEVLDKGSMVIAGIDRDSVVRAVRMARRMFDEAGPPPLPDDYQDLNVSAKVVKIIESYAKLIDRYVWMKPVPARGSRRG